MSVLINKKMCDNARECSCIVECPNKAFYYDEENETVAVKESLCTKCRICMIACDAGAVKVARDEEEYNRIKKEYDEDIRTVEELFVDRYGASIVNEDYLVDIDKLDTIIEDSNKMLLIEFINNDEAKCLVKSIPVEEIINCIKGDISYRKCEVDDSILEKYNISELPSLLIYKNKDVIGKYEGFCDINDKNELLDYIKGLNI